MAILSGSSDLSMHWPPRAAVKPHRTTDTFLPVFRLFTRALAGGAAFCYILNTFKRLHIMEAQTLFQNLDIQLFWLINTARSPFLDGFYALLTNLGSGWVAIPVLAVIVSFATPRSSVMRALVFIAVAMTVCGLTNSAIKHTVLRQRPLKYFAEIRHERLAQGEDLPAGPGPESLVPYVFGPRWKYRSFPSGHANTAFSAAMVLFLF